MHRIAFAILSVAALAGTAPFAAAATRVDTPSARRMTNALNLLEAKGYGDFKDFHAGGGNFTAAVTQDGQSFTVTVDPDTGQVTRQS